MYTISVDDEVGRELSEKRKVARLTENDMLRKMLGLEPKEISLQNIINDLLSNLNKGWVSEDIVFPNGTLFRGSHRGNLKEARVEDGKLLVGDVVCSSLSKAAREACGPSAGQKNGWAFWLCLIPDAENWVRVGNLRKTNARLSTIVKS